MNIQNANRYLSVRGWTLSGLIGICCGMSLLEAAQFTPPDIKGFNLHDERDADGDGDGENETRLRQYLNKNGDSLVSFTTNGRLWAWSLDTRDDEVGSRNYVIRDSNCDGTFDEVYGLDDEFHVPDCTR